MFLLVSHPYFCRLSLRSPLDFFCFPFVGPPLFEDLLDFSVLDLSFLFAFPPYFVVLGSLRSLSLIFMMTEVSATICSSLGDMEFQFSDLVNISYLFNANFTS